MYFMFSMNKYRKDEVFDQTLNNNFQTRRTVRDTLTVKNKKYLDTYILKDTLLLYDLNKLQKHL